MTETAAEYWENRYRENGKSWSGNVNAALEREVGGVAPGTALDLGSGEGGDALWLARNGWSVTAIDISPTALAIGAASQSPEDDITWVAADLSEWQPLTTYDLVTSCFLHSTVDLPREEIHRRAAAAVAPGGLLVIVGHAGVPHWAHLDAAAHHPELPGPDEVFESLQLDDGWTVITKALIERTATAPDGSTGAITDSVVTLRRTSHHA
jgi:SAM-dependent methyltransferase